MRIIWAWDDMYHAIGIGYEIQTKSGMKRQAFQIRFPEWLGRYFFKKFHGGIPEED